MLKAVREAGVFALVILQSMAFVAVMLALVASVQVVPVVIGQVGDTAAVLPGAPVINVNVRLGDPAPGAGESATFNFLMVMSTGAMP